MPGRTVRLGRVKPQTLDQCTKHQPLPLMLAAMVVCFKIEDLSDLEVVVLLSLVAREHCIIDTEGEALDDLENELILIARDIFGLSHATLNCSPETTLEEFSNAILTPDVERPDFDILSSFTSCETGRNAERSTIRSGQLSADKSSSQVPTGTVDDRKIVNIVIAKNFDRVSDEIQIQALDLIRTKRIYTRAAFHSAPNTFLFIPLVESKPQPLSSSFNRHLCDHIFMSYYHDPQNGFANLEDSTGWFPDDQGSMSSVVGKSSIPLFGKPDQAYVICDEHINTLRQLSNNVTVSADVNCYLQNIIVFLRMNRGVASGITSISSRHFYLLARCLAPLQRVDYLFPSLVALAARRVYRHRIRVVEPAGDRSMMYGSSLKAVGLVLADMTPETIIETVLVEIEPPL
ncbi:uncharacterized protein PADG_06892 [Paracoccidioides brasiliensis Pb18]|uniref:Magnesium chelatase n=1 Tax=Paracoccidioides brasiliensis (strain Pb18) TaxID=502780 RepID=C1GI06_PARBD|nr:uncharacterized protein PADG_06892 [Paracoccidioides brasiliensis Pb18]EEH50813.2 hypothetical protein PADG_06892 [Paracoccidioides brasiliensis Pb18]